MNQQNVFRLALAGLAVSSAVVMACSGAAPSRPSALPQAASAPKAASAEDGLVGASAVGDVKTGSGALEIIRLRMDRQMPAGTSVLRQYALPGVTYRMNPGETIELWAEWDPDSKFVPTVIPANPNMTVDWGIGEGTTDTNCGSCKLTHTYPKPGVYKVVVTLNDRNGTRVSRTFYLNSEEPPAPEPEPDTSTDTGTGTDTSVQP